MTTTTATTTTYYFYECGICDQLHPCGFAGDCRDDQNRFAIDELEERYGFENVVTVPMDEADDWPAQSTGECDECGHPGKAGDETHYPECSRAKMAV